MIRGSQKLYNIQFITTEDNGIISNSDEISNI